MSALTAAPIEVRTEIRGAPGRLFTEANGEIVIAGSAGTGKTRAILEWIHARCQTETIRVLILRKTQESAKSSVMVTYREQVLAGFDGKRSTLDGVTYFGGNKLLPAQFTYEDTKAVIIVSGMDNVAKVLSTEYDIVYVNECTELTLAEWEQLTGRTDRPSLVRPPVPSVVVGDCNPDAPTHWIRRRAQSGALKLWTSKHEDNPAMWDRIAKRWTEGGRRYLERLDKLTGVRYQRLRLGNWVAAEGQVLDKWDRDVHVVTRAQAELLGFAEARRHVCGVDWGWTHPAVLSVFAVGFDDAMLLVHEIYATRMGQDEMVAAGLRLDSQYDIEKFLCDPSQPAYIEAMVKAGLRAEKGENAILPGVTAIQNRLNVDAGNRRARFYVLADCLEAEDPILKAAMKPTTGVREVDAYVWPPHVDGRKEKPVDANNHAIDSWRYAVMHVDGGGVGFERVPDDLAGTLAMFGA